MKKFLSLTLVLVMVISMFALTACPEKNQIPTEDFVLNGETLNTDEKIEITFYHTMGANLRAELEKALEDFKKLYPNITVIQSQEGGYDDVRDKVSKQLTTGAQPNVTYCYPDHVALYNLTGISVVKLDQFINDPELGLTKEQVDDFIDAYYNEGKQFGDGYMYTLPLSKSTEVLYYNKTFFEANGLTPPKTWDEMEDVCAQILAIDSNCIPLGYDSESNWFITMCEQLKSPYTSTDPENRFQFNNDANKAFVKRFAEWYSKGYVTTQEIHEAYTSTLFVETNPTKIKSYMSIGSSAGATHQCPKPDDKGNYPFEVGIVPIPQADENNKKAISQGPSLCILNNVNRQEVIASWLLVKFLTTNINFQVGFAKASGYVPVIESAFEHEVYKAFMDAADGGEGIAALSAQVCMQQKDYYYTSPAFNGSSAARDQVGYLIQTILLGYDDNKDNLDAYIDEEFEKAIKKCEKLTTNK